MGPLRVILATAVLISHSGPIFGYAPMPASTAVQAFYIISGFYMSLVLDRKYPATTNGRWAFYTARFLRLAPTYWVIALATLVTFIISGTSFVTYLIPQWREFRAAPLFAQAVIAASNALIFGQDLLVFYRLDPTAATGFAPSEFADSGGMPAMYYLLVPQAWSLGLELTFYLLAPFVVRKSIRLVLLLCVLSLLLRLILYGAGLNHDPWTYRFFPCELLLFLLGNLSYRFYRTLPAKTIRRKDLGVAGWLFAIGASTVFFPLGLGLKPDLAQVIYLALLPWVLPFAFGLTANSRWDRAIGELSYPMYLSHFLLSRFVGWAGPHKGIALLTLTLLVSILLHLAVERPVQRLRERLTNAVARHGPGRGWLRFLKRRDEPEARREYSGPSADLWFSPPRFSALLAILIFALYPELLLGSHSLFFRDFGHFGYPLAHYFRETFWSGQIPLWNPLNHCGIPFLAQWNTMVFYPLSALYLILPLNWGLNLFCVLHVFLGGLGMYFLARSWVRNNFAASVAGFIFTFNGLTVNCLMWPAIVSALGLMPWVVWCTVAAWRSGGRRMILAALIGTAQMFTGGVEIILFTWLFLAVFCVGDILARPPSRTGIFGRFAAIVLLIAGLSAIQILPFLDLLQHSQRSDSSLGGVSSMPALGWANFLVPLFGTLKSPTGLYFQPGQWWLTSYYLGIGSVALALVALVSTPCRRHITLGLLAAFFLTLALGEAGFLYKWLLSAFPPLGLIRYPIKFVIPIAFIVPILAAVAVSRTATAIPAQARSLRIRIVAIGAVFLLLLGLLCWFSYQHPVSKDLVDATRMNALGRGLFLVAVLTLTLFLFCPNSRSPLSRTMQLLLRCGFLFLLWLDVWTHAPKQAPTIPKEILVADLKIHRAMNPLPVAGESRALLSRAAQATFDRTLLADSTSSYLGIRLGLYCNCNLLEGIPKVDGFYPLNLKRPAAVEHRLYNIPELELNEGVLNFLAVSQITADGSVTDWRHRTNYLPVISTGQKPVFASDAEALRGIFAREFDPATMIYLPEDARTQVPVTQPTQAQILVHSFGSHRVHASVRAEETAVVSISQAFHHPWKAYIDGTPARIWRANHAFQALVVPPGDHEIILLYRDTRFLSGVIISIASLLVCLVAWRRLE